MGYLFNNWNCKTLEELIDDKTIGLVKGAREQDNDFAYDYVKMHNISNQNSWNPFKIAKVNATESEIEKFRLRDDDLLFNTRNSFELVGKSCLFKSTSNNPVLFNNNIMRIRFGPDIDQRFAAYAFCSPDVLRQLEEMKQGTTNVSAIYFKTLKTLKIRFPPIAEQLYIVAILDQAFADIEKARATAETNLKNARELFDSYLQQVFSQRGEGWVETTLGQMAEVSSGGTPLKSKTEFWDGAIPWYSSGELNSTFTTDSKELITETGLNNSNAKLFPKGSLLIGMYDTAALKMSILDRQGAFNQAIAGVKPNENIVLEFVLHSINHIKPELLKLRRGVRQKNLNQSRIKAIPIRVPPVSEQIKIVQELKVLREKTDTLFDIYEKKLKSLEELKKSILQKAFTGELTKSKGIAA